MKKFDKEILILRKRLDELQRQKRKDNKPKVKSMRPRGRPRTDPNKIRIAKELAKDYPLPDVALKMDLSLDTLYRYGIKRKILNAEKELEAKRDLPSEISPGQSQIKSFLCAEVSAKMPMSALFCLVWAKSHLKIIMLW